MNPITDRHTNIKLGGLKDQFMQVQMHFSEDPLLRLSDFFTPHTLDCYFDALVSDHFTKFVLHHTFPIFKEEIPIPYVEIWQIHHQFIENLEQINDLHALPFIRDFILSRPFSEFLIILGQRITPASVQTENALPPSRAILIEQAFAPYNQEIKLAVRAWEKHVGRNETEFWGVIDGTPTEKEAHVIQLVNDIIENHTWWNVFEHFKHEFVYEIRAESGHGMRWSISNKNFIGFVEPF